MIRDIARATLKALSGPPQPGVGAWGSRYQWPSLPGERSYRAIVGDGMSNSIVAATVLWIARNFPKAPVKLERLIGEEETERVRRHPFLDLMRRPNPYYAGVTMDWAIIVSFVTDGNAYKLKRRTENDRVAEEWYVPHWMIEPAWPRDGSAYLSHYDYKPGEGRVYRVEVEDVVHYRYGLDPHNTRKGMSPLKSLLREVYTDEEAARFSASILHNLGVPGLIVSPRSETIDANTAAAVKARLTQDFGGDNRGGIFVPYGPTDVEQIGFNPQQLDLGSIRDIPEERVTAVLGVPAAVVGFGTGLQQTKVGATMRELREIAWEDGIMALHTVMAPEIRRAELSEFVDRIDDWTVGFDYDKVPELGETLQERATALLDGVRAGAAEVADWRHAVGLDVDERHAIFLRPFNVIEVGASRTPATGDTAPVRPVAPTGAALSGRTSGTKASSADTRYLRTLDQIARRTSERMADDLADLFDALGVRARNAYVATGAKAIELDPDDEGLVVRIIRAIGLQEWAERELTPLFRRYTELVAEATYGAVAQRVGVDVSWDIADPYAVALIESGGRRAGLLDLTEDTRKALYRAIAEARELGEGPIAVARRIRDEVPAGPYPNAGAKYRAELIARTETLNAQRASTLAAGQSAGFDQYLVFDARLGDTDADCELLDQAVVSLEEAERLMADEHPNGTRSFSPIPRTSGQASRSDQRHTKSTDAGTLALPMGPEALGALIRRDMEIAAYDAAAGPLYGITDPFRCSSCKRLLAEAAGPGTRIKCRCGTLNEAA